MGQALEPDAPSDRLEVNPEEGKPWWRKATKCDSPYNGDVRCFHDVDFGRKNVALANKLGIANNAELAQVEERLSKLAAVKLFDSGELDSLDPGTYESLAKIHERLFGAVYGFAGKMRDVDIAKGGFRFAPVLYLSDAVARIGEMPQSTFDEIIEKYVEMNVAHPFREGNGRAMRIWLDAMLKARIGKVVDWSQVNREDYLLAMERSPVRDVEIKSLLRSALTEAVDDREVFMKGIDASYAYEGYSAYNASEL